MKPFTISISRRAVAPLTLFAAIMALLVAAASAAAGPDFTIKKQQRIGGAGVVYNNDQTTVQRQEKLVGLRAGGTVKVTLRCQAGYYVVDGGALLQQVDEGAGTPADMVILQSESTSRQDYTFELENPTAGNALAKVFVTCVKQGDHGVVQARPGSDHFGPRAAADQPRVHAAEHHGQHAARDA